MHKIIIQPTTRTGFYHVILLEKRKLSFFKWWKEISVTEHEEEIAFEKASELIEKYNIQSGDVYDWSGDGFKGYKYDFN